MSFINERKIFVLLEKKYSFNIANIIFAYCIENYKLRYINDKIIIKYNCLCNILYNNSCFYNLKKQDCLSKLYSDNDIKNMTNNLPQCYYKKGDYGNKIFLHMIENKKVIYKTESIQLCTSCQWSNKKNCNLCLEKQEEYELFIKNVNHIKFLEFNCFEDYYTFSSLSSYKNKYALYKEYMNIKNLFFKNITSITTFYSLNAKNVFVLNTSNSINTLNIHVLVHHDEISHIIENDIEIKLFISGYDMITHHTCETSGSYFLYTGDDNTINLKKTLKRNKSYYLEIYPFKIIKLHKIKYLSM